jgi:hypothetical protein
MVKFLQILELDGCVDMLWEMFVCQQIAHNIRLQYLLKVRFHVRKNKIGAFLRKCFPLFRAPHNFISLRMATQMIVVTQVCLSKLDIDSIT